MCNTVYSNSLEYLFLSDSIFYYVSRRGCLWRWTPSDIVLKASKGHEVLMKFTSRYGDGVNNAYLSRAVTLTRRAQNHIFQTFISTMPHLAFKAGRAFRREGTNFIDPSPTKGAIMLQTGEDGLLHFMWKNRLTNEVEEVRSIVMFL